MASVSSASASCRAVCPNHADELPRLEADDDGAENRREQARGARSGEPAERVDGGVRRRLWHRGRHALDRVVQQRPVESRCWSCSSCGCSLAPQQHEDHQQHVGRPGEQRLRARCLRMRAAALRAPDADEQRSATHGGQGGKISVSCGPTKLETTNCVPAKAMPHTAAAGKTPRRPLQPAITRIR